MVTYEKRGYLNSDFKLFHLTDTKKQDFEYHYHDFDKILIFIKGNVDYMIEGHSYHLHPYDIVLVNHNDIHKPDIDPDTPYERIIVYLSPRFITSYQTETYDLSACFRAAKEQCSHVLRPSSLKKSGLLYTVNNLEYACSHEEYAGQLYRQVLFLEFMIQLNRSVLENQSSALRTGSYNEKIAVIIAYINKHLTDNLTVEHLSETFYISKYHLMHLFKKETGCTIGNYLTEKRIFLARELLRGDRSAMQICLDCGFENYSTFSRAYKKCLGESPLSTRRRCSIP